MKPTPSTDIYKEAYQEYVNTAFTDKLEKEFRILPYHLRYRILYYVALGFTYIFNVLSFATASALVYFLLTLVFPVWLAFGVTLSLAVLLEIAKRKTATTWTKNYFLTGSKNWGLVGVIAVLSIISIVGSYYGTNKTIHEITPNYAAVKVDSLAEMSAISLQLQLLRDDKAKLEKQKNNEGKTYYSVLPAISNISSQIVALESEALAIQKDTRTTNKNGAIDHGITTRMTANNVSLFSFACEILYLLLVVWCKYYRYKSYQVLTAIQEKAMSKKGVTPSPTGSNKTATNQNNHNTAQKSNNGTPNASPTNPNPSTNNNKPETSRPNENKPQYPNGELEQLKTERAKIKKKLNVNKQRLVKGTGNAETLRNNIKKYTDEIKGIDAKIRPMLGNR